MPDMPHSDSRHKGETLPDRTCADCGLTKPREDFGTRSVRGKPYPEPYCRPCRARRARERRAREKENG